MVYFCGRTSSRFWNLTSFSTVLANCLPVMFVQVNSGLILLEFTRYFNPFCTCFQHLSFFPTLIFNCSQLSPIIGRYFDPWVAWQKIKAYVSTPNQTALWRNNSFSKFHLCKDKRLQLLKKITKLIKMNNYNDRCKLAIDGCNGSCQINSFIMKEWQQVLSCIEQRGLQIKITVTSSVKYNL